MQKPAKILDYLGISASTLCLIHCFALPVMMIAAPALSLESAHSESFHVWMLALVVPLALAAYIHGFLHHKKTWILGLGVASVALLILPILLGLEAEAHASHAGHAHAHGHHHHDEGGLFSLAHVMSFIGSLGLITAHIFNTRNHHCEHDGESCALDDLAHEHQHDIAGENIEIPVQVQA